MLIISRCGCRAYGSTWCREELWQHLHLLHRCDPKDVLQIHLKRFVLQHFFIFYNCFFVRYESLSREKLWLCNWAVTAWSRHKMQTDTKLCKLIKESNDLPANRLRRQPDALRLSRPAGLSICQLFARTWSHWLWWDYCCFKFARF